MEFDEAFHQMLLVLALDELQSMSTEQVVDVYIYICTYTYVAVYVFSLVSY